MPPRSLPSQPLPRQREPGQPSGELCRARCVHPEQVALARARLADDETYREVALLFGALADPTRAKIVHALLSQELCTCDLAAVAGISESGISQHLRVLRALRMVKARRAGKYVYYRLDDAHVATLMRMGLTHQGHAEVALGAAHDRAQNVAHDGARVMPDVAAGERGA